MGNWVATEIVGMDRVEEQLGSLCTQNGLNTFPYQVQNSHGISNKHSFDKAELEICGNGDLFGSGNAQLPSPPLLMLDRILDIQSGGGDFNRGYATAELDVEPNNWFFNHHFRGDPVMPGCFLIESLWQLTGFHMAWSGYKGKGRVLESGRTRFIEPVLQVNQTLSIRIHVRKVLGNKNPIYISNGIISCDEIHICRSESIIVGLW